MFDYIFVKILKFLRILYSLYTILTIFKVNKIYPIEFGQIIFRIANLFLGKTMENCPMSEISDPKIISAYESIYAHVTHTVQ
jgi:hypothetical protein